MSAEDQIQVHPGDIIGIHYITVVSGDGVVSYEQYGTTSTDGLSPAELSRVIRINLADRALPIGVTKPVVVHHANRLPALEPVTHCCEEMFDLTGMFLLPNIIGPLTWVKHQFKLAQQHHWCLCKIFEWLKMFRLLTMLTDQQRRHICACKVVPLLTTRFAWKSNPLFEALGYSMHPNLSQRNVPPPYMYIYIYTMID